VTRPARRAFALAALCMTACTGSLFQSKAAPPTIYLLAAGLGSPPAAVPPGGVPPSGAPPATLPMDLAVLKPRVRPGLESDRIAVLYPDRHLDYLADARWSGPLAEVLQDAAVQEFHARAHLRTVSADASVFASAYWLEMEVADFQAEYTGAAGAPVVHVHFLARLGTSGDRRILGQFVAEAREPAAENRLTAIVDAYARATDTALGQIVEGIGQTLTLEAR
jgi:cholesterol transport system auxiliary component